MIEVNEGKVKVQGNVNIVELECAFLLTSIYEKEPESLKRILQFCMDYMEGKISLQRREVYDDSL